MVPYTIYTTSDVESVPSVQIQFTYRVLLINYRNGGLMATEEIWCTSSLGSYMVNSPPHDQLILSSINTSLLYLYYNSFHKAHYIYSEINLILHQKFSILDVLSSLWSQPIIQVNIVNMKDPDNKYSNIHGLPPPTLFKHVPNIGIKSDHETSTILKWCKRLE